VKGGSEMLTVRLFCAAGMSTSLLVNKMIEEAQKAGEEVDIVAFPVNELDRRLDGVDVALLGPQVGFMKAKSKKIAESHGVPLDVIPMADYGRCNGKAVLELAKKLANK
jgi:PTS system cellobiose-specific IIB component